MEQLNKLISSIQPADTAAIEAAHAHWNSLAKPLGSLGLLETAVERIAGLVGSAEVTLTQRTLLVLCADNGVVARGVTQSDSSVTAAVAAALARSESTVCHIARTAGCSVVPVDMGIHDFVATPGVVDRRIANGTADITVGAAMSREQCVKAIMAGVGLVGELRDRGVSIIATGEMGIGNTTTSAAVASVMLGQPPVVMTGRGAGLSDEGLTRKISAIETAIAVNQPDPTSPLDVLAKVGGFDIAGLCGVFLGAAYHRVPVIIDGFISSVAALCAVRLCPNALCAMLASHLSAEPAGMAVMSALGLSPMITAGLRLGEGSGAVAILPLLDMALAVYNSGQTFGRLGIDAYTRQ